MFFRVDFNAGPPAYQQIVDQVKYAAASGALRPGDPLPSIRSLAEDLRVNRNTVVKAYDELESQGVIVARQGKGCVLSDAPSPMTKEARLSTLSTAVDRLLTEAHHLNIADSDLDTLLHQRRSAMQANFNQTSHNQHSNPSQDS